MARVAAWLFDGVSARRREVELVSDGGEQLELIATDGGAELDPVALSSLVRREDQGGHPVFGHADIHGWRLGITGAIPPDLAARLPGHKHYGGVIDRFGLWPTAGAFAAVSAVALLVAFTVPQWLAPLVPPSWEQRMGDAIVGDFGGRFCDAAPGKAVLDAMVAKIDRRKGLQVEVANIDMVNAAALPGGKVILFKGLILNAKSPEEVAGVLAHEIGHVRERHVMQALLRQFGLSILLGGANSDAIGQLGGIVTLGYGREAEREADQFARTRMRAADISPLGVAAFFRRLAKAEAVVGEGRAARLVGYISSHPLSTERRAAFEASARKGHNYTPTLSKAQWTALKRICRDDKDVKEFDLF